MKKTNLLVLATALLLTGCAGGGTSTSTTSGTSSQGSSSEPGPTPAEFANGVYNYKFASGEEKTKILGLLEKWAVENKLTGLTLFENGGYALYQNFIVKGSPTYIPGYGFGNLSEGNITADHPGETIDAYKRYWHSLETDDPGHINYMNDKGAVVGDLIGYHSSGYWEQRMNETKDGYDWVGLLSKTNRPIAVNPDENGLATKYKFEVKVGEEFKYDTKTTDSTLSAFKGREVELEDYITPYKIYYTKAYNMARGSENLTGSGSIKGSSNYYASSADGFNAEAWENIGIKSYVEGGKSFLEFEFNAACTPFYAMYYLTSSMFAPVPADFIETLGDGDFANGVKLWGCFNADKGYTPVDTILSTGPYTLEYWEKDKLICWGKSSTFNHGNLYKIPGVHVVIAPAAKDDLTFTMKEFNEGRLSSVGLNKTTLNEYKNDPRAVTTTGDATFKLNMNTCDDETWEKLFGENGSVLSTPKSQYWDCEPAMANKDFTTGLSLAINRKEIANVNGKTPSCNFFASEYYTDPENGIAYNNSPEHAAAIASLTEGTDGYGYSLERAKASFKKASDDLIAQGYYKAGDTIHIQVAWQAQSNITSYGEALKGYFESAFNTCGGSLTLEIENIAVAVWSDIYYKMMMAGQFDIAFGSISGNSYDPLNFMEVLMSDNSSGFCLNYGVDSNKPSEDLVYDGVAWSYDALYLAADRGVYTKDGAKVQPFQVNATKLVKNSDGTGTLTSEIELQDIDVDGKKVKATIDHITFYSVSDMDYYSDYCGDFDTDGYTFEDGLFTYIVPAEVMEEIDNCEYVNPDSVIVGCDMYFNVNFLGNEDSQYYGKNIAYTPNPALD